MKYLLIYLIKAYKFTISPFLGHCCRFVPSCSEYGIEAIKKHGSFKGTWRLLKRLSKCHPWHRGGYDPLE